MRSVLKQILLYLCLFLGVATLKAQHVEYGVALDTNYMMIGDQQHLTFKAKVDPGVRIVFPRLQDTVVHGLEIISGPVRDSVKEKDGRWLLEENMSSLLSIQEYMLCLLSPLRSKVRNIIILFGPIP